MTSKVLTQSIVLGHVGWMGAGDIGLGLDTTPPSNCVELDGSTITGGAATYPIVAARYPWMVVSGNIVLPDTRGKFLRGWAHGSTNDPDRASRTARVGDSQTGDFPGTYQGHAFFSHSHNVNTPHAAGAVYAVDGNSGTAGTTPQTSSAAGGNETRPINVNVMFFMKVG